MGEKKWNEAMVEVYLSWFCIVRQSKFTLGTFLTEWLKTKEKNAHRLHL